jgi:hypothetical protein
VVAAKSTKPAKQAKSASAPTRSSTTAAKPDWLVATIHPSAVLRSPDRDVALEGLVADLQVAAAAM